MANPAAMTVLKQSPIFGALSAGTLQEIADLCANRHFAAGEMLFLQGDPGNVLFGVISGRIRITVSSEEGQELHVNLIQPGEIIGEIAFLDGGARTATATAAESSTCFAIQRTPFLALLEQRPEISRHLLMLLCERVRWTSRLVADSAFLTVRDRLAARIGYIAAKGEPVGATGVRVRISQQELATHLGVSRQVVNGYLKEWQDAGVVEVSRGTITIADLQSFQTRIPGATPALRA